jgi:hypothetical protein
MLGRCTCEGLAPIQGKNTVVGATETRIMESVRLSATVSHDIRTRLASLASLGTFVTLSVLIALSPSPAAPRHYCLGNEMGRAKPDLGRAGPGY